MTSLLLALLLAQTRPLPQQIVNDQQVRICNSGDSRDSTLVRSCDIADGRYIGQYPDGSTTICIIQWVRVDGISSSGNLRTSVCFSPTGLSQVLLQSSDWAAWWDSHK